MIAEPAPATQTEAAGLPGLCHAVIEHAPLPMALVAGPGHLVREVNPAFCRLLNQTRAELVGKPFRKIMPEEDECATSLDRVFRTGQPASQAGRKHSKPHPIFRSYVMWPVLAEAHPVGVMIQVNETAQFQEMAVAMNEALLLGSVRQHEMTEAADNLNVQLAAEITVRERAEEQLLAAKDELKRHAAKLEEAVAERTAQLRETIGELEAFSYSVSHDMRAPLRAMRGFAELLLDRHSARLDAEGVEYLRKIEAASGRMDALIQDVLAYTHVLWGQMHTKPVDLDALVRQVIATYPQLHADGVNIQIEGVLPKVMGGEASLAPCLSNLLSNAVKFVAPGSGPIVKVRAEAIGADIRLWVEDRGIGIAPEDQTRIFKMFERVDRATAYEGTGMGLAIVRKAVERMGGRLGVESSSGQGSKFWLQLKGARP